MLCDVVAEVEVDFKPVSQLLRRLIQASLSSKLTEQRRQSHYHICTSSFVQSFHYRRFVRNCFNIFLQDFSTYSSNIMFKRRDRRKIFRQAFMYSRCGKWFRGKRQLWFTWNENIWAKLVWTEWVNRSEILLQLSTRSLYRAVDKEITFFLLISAQLVTHGSITLNYKFVTKPNTQADNRWFLI